MNDQTIRALYVPEAPHRHRNPLSREESRQIHGMIDDEVYGLSHAKAVSMKAFHKGRAGALSDVIHYYGEPMYRMRNPASMLVLGNPAPSFIVFDSLDGTVVYSKAATGVGSEALNAAHREAQKFADKTGRIHYVSLNTNRSVRRGSQVSVQGEMIMGISETVYPRGNNPLNRKETMSALDRAHELSRLMSSHQARGEHKAAMYAAGGMNEMVNVVHKYGKKGVWHPSVFQQNPDTSCQMCGGPVFLLGQLGNLEHLECRDCGMQYSREIQSRAMSHRERRRSRSEIPVQDRRKNPSTSSNEFGVPNYIWRDPKFQKELKAYKRRHGSMPSEIRQVEVPAGSPKFMSAWGHIPEVKYDAPSHSTKGKRIHRFGEGRRGRGKMPWLVSSQERGGKHLQIIGGNFNASGSWIRH